MHKYDIEDGHWTVEHSVLFLFTFYIISSLLRNLQERGFEHTVTNPKKQTGPG